MIDKDRKILSGKPLAWVLTLVYFASYVTRINFAAIIQEVVTETGFKKSELSVVLVCTWVAYGIGQVISGILGDKVKPQDLMLCGLAFTTAINLLFPLCSSYVLLMAIFWGLNGFAQAMLWPPIVKILVATASEEVYGYSMVRISWGSSFGTVIVYLTAPFIIRFFGWRGVFIFCGSVGLAATVLWGILRTRIDLNNGEISAEPSRASANFKFPKAAIFPTIFMVLSVICQGMLRDGVTSWMPTYLAEVFDLENSVSIFCTVALAIFSIICFYIVGTIYRIKFKNEVACGCAVFATAAISAALLFTFFGGGAVVAIFSMAMITGCMHGVNLMLITHVPKRFKRYGNISTVSGALNACTYIGSAISTYGIALLSEIIGWRNTVGVWFIIALIGTLNCFIAAHYWKKFIDQN